MPLGPLFVDIEGTSLTEEDRELLKHPLVSGVILFSRNYHDPTQLQTLVQDIHRLREPRLLVCVDHEGGRVQRFREGFTHIPPAGRFGVLYDKDKKQAKELVEQAGWLMAVELRACGVDFSFAPVLDLDRGVSKVIGDRAYHSKPPVVAELAFAFMSGMRRAGMAATGKHFPGHGAVEADSHEAIPVDQRDFDTIYHADIQPFEHMIRNGLAAIMPAHVIYEKVDSHPAGFSSFWLQEVLRRRLKFQGIIFSDDINMEGASVAGDYTSRAQAAVAAGCDVVLLCNNRPQALQVVDTLKLEAEPLRQARLARMHGQKPIRFSQLQQSEQWHRAVAGMNQILQDETLNLDFSA